MVAELNCNHWSGDVTMLFEVCLERDGWVESRGQFTTKTLINQFDRHGTYGLMFKLNEMRVYDPYDQTTVVYVGRKHEDTMQIFRLR